MILGDYTFIELLIIFDEIRVKSIPANTASNDSNFDFTQITFSFYYFVQISKRRVL